MVWGKVILVLSDFEIWAMEGFSSLDQEKNPRKAWMWPHQKVLDDINTLGRLKMPAGNLHDLSGGLMTRVRDLDLLQFLSGQVMS